MTLTEALGVTVAILTFWFWIEQLDRRLSELEKHYQEGKAADTDATQARALLSFPKSERLDDSVEL